MKRKVLNLFLLLSAPAAQAHAQSAEETIFFMIHALRPGEQNDYGALIKQNGNSFSFTAPLSAQQKKDNPNAPDPYPVQTVAISKESECKYKVSSSGFDRMLIQKNPNGLLPLQLIQEETIDFSKVDLTNIIGRGTNRLSLKGSPESVCFIDYPPASMPDEKISKHCMDEVRLMRRGFFQEADYKAVTAAMPKAVEYFRTKFCSGRAF